MTTNAGLGPSCRWSFCPDSRWPLAGSFSEPAGRPRRGLRFSPILLLLGLSPHQAWHRHLAIVPTTLEAPSPPAGPAGLPLSALAPPSGPALWPAG